MSNDRFPFQYTILRYVHDIASGEFVNVGVVVTADAKSKVAGKFRKTYGRLKGAFPSLDGEAFKLKMRRLQTIIDDMSAGDLTLPVDGGGVSAVGCEHIVLPVDDSSLQWSPSGSGITRDLEATTEKLFQRFVMQHDYDVVGERRKDEDVWRNFRSALEKRNVLGQLGEKTIAVADDSVRFHHAWKNGAWHCYEPVSFDLSSDSAIKEKAHRWLGQLASIRGSADAFKVYFLVGRPADASLSDAYAKAVSILNKGEHATTVEEDAIEQFSDAVATKIRDHLDPGEGSL